MHAITIAGRLRPRARAAPALFLTSRAHLKSLLHKDLMTVRPRARADKRKKFLLSIWAHWSAFRNSLNRKDLRVAKCARACAGAARARGRTILGGKEPKSQGQGPVVGPGAGSPILAIASSRCMKSCFTMTYLLRLGPL